MQFKKDYFSFNGIYSRKYGYKIITLDDGFESIFGLERSVDKEKGVNGEDIIYGVENSDLTLTVSFAKVDEFNNPSAYTKEELKFITRWLFKGEYLPFECDGLIYYAMFTKATRWDNFANRGYITLEMEVLNGMAYEPVQEIEKSFIGTNYMYIYNDSTATDILYPNYEFTLNGGQTLSILNETTGQTVNFSGLSIGEKIIVDNNLRDMRSENNLKKNIYKLSNKEWLYLANGRNVLKIQGSCSFKISYQNKMCLI